VKVAVLIDGSFFIKRYRLLHKLEPGFSKYDYHATAQALYAACMTHVGSGNLLYRVLYYDCYPFEKSVTNPISGLRIDFSKTDEAKFRTGLFEQLKRMRKVALRLGHIKDHKTWEFQPRVSKELLAKRTTVSQITEKDVVYSMTQKGVDIRIGCDISALSYKHLVECIVLMSGDCDLVPAAKIARREGIDFILDPMWNPIDPTLLEHADGIRSTGPKPIHITASPSTATSSKYLP
jgi:uncharacterized LabA/DUF88 family protein